MREGIRGFQDACGWMDQTANMEVYVCGLKGERPVGQGQDEDERSKERRKVLENRRNGGFCFEEEVTF